MMVTAITSTMCFRPVENGLTGCFFPPAKAVTEHEVLDVNKIHFILAAVPDKRRILHRSSA